MTCLRLIYLLDQINDFSLFIFKNILYNIIRLFAIFQFIVYRHYATLTPEHVTICHEMYLYVENGK